MPGKKKSRFLKVNPVGPTLNWERGYEKVLRKQVVTPYLNSINRVFADALLNLPSDVIPLGVSVRIGEALQGVQLDQAKLTTVVDDSLRKLGLQHTMKVNRVFKAAIGVDITPLLQTENVSRYFDLKITENVDLIKTMSEKHKDELFHKFQAQLVDNPFDREEITKFLREGNRSAGYNLRRICRDQNNKMIGQLNEIRQTEIGVQKYEWSTSRDIRVRPTHRANEEKVFSWDDPPATGHPGAEIQCRCVSLALLSTTDVQRIKKNVFALDPKQAPKPTVPTWQLTPAQHIAWAKRRYKELNKGASKEVKDWERRIKKLDKEYEDLGELQEKNAEEWNRLRYTYRTKEEQKRYVVLNDEYNKIAEKMDKITLTISNMNTKIRLADPMMKVRKELRDRLLRPKGQEVDIPDLDLQIPKSYTKAEKERIAANIAEALDVYRRGIKDWPKDDLGKPIKVVFRKRVRARANEFDRVVTLSPYDEPGVIAHELEHLREAAIRRKTGKMPAIDFLHKRTKADLPENKLRKINDIENTKRYKPKEVSRKDKFEETYAGKDYGLTEGNVNWAKRTYPNEDFKFVKDPWGRPDMWQSSTEVQTIAIQDLLFPESLKYSSMVFNDAEYAKWAIKTLLRKPVKRKVKWPKNV